MMQASLPKAPKEDSRRRCGMHGFCVLGRFSKTQSLEKNKKTSCEGAPAVIDHSGTWRKLERNLCGRGSTIRRC